MADTEYTYSGIGSGRKTFTAGTAAALASSATPSRQVRVKAFVENTGKIVLGGSAVVAALATRQGIELAPGEALVLHIDDVSKIYGDSEVTGEGVEFIYLYN
jgi:hypothetical protein